ncbi:MAG: hypothetical protein V7603_6676 [Micromonosporaceae bacterium]
MDVASGAEIMARPPCPLSACSPAGEVIRGSDAVSIGYDTLGRRQTLTLPARVTHTYGYDDAGG